MPNTRVVTGPILGPQGEPLADFRVGFAITAGPDGSVQYDEYGSYPWTEIEVETDDTGDFSLDMVTNVIYEIAWIGAVQEDGRVKRYPPGVGFRKPFVVPPGETAISLQTIWALGSIKPDDPTIAQIIEAAVQDIAASILAGSGVIDGGGPGSTYDGTNIDGGTV